MSVARIDLLLICHCMHINSISVEFDTVLQNLHKESTGEAFLTDCHNDLLDLRWPQLEFCPMLSVKLARRVLAARLLKKSFTIDFCLLCLVL